MLLKSIFEDEVIMSHIKLSALHWQPIDRVVQISSDGDDDEEIDGVARECTEEI